MNARPTRLPGVIVVEPRVVGDARGFFFESFHAERYAAAGITESFVQDNVSHSRRGVLRGLHAQHPHAQGKLVSVLRGEIFDVAVDIRRDSSTCGQWEGVVLSDANKQQLYIPPGFAHGFQVLSDEALVVYKCTAYYDPAAECTVLWNDPDLAIEWPLADPVLSAKDGAGTRLRDLPDERRPRIGA